MKKITLKQLKLLNFKGVREKTIDFSHVTDIYGNNGTGKTTIMDAFLWLLFGKDSTNRTDFGIKTVDENNNVFHKMSHEVSAVIDVDGDEVNIRRTYKENWPTKKGTATETFSGHTNSFFWNEVPMKETDFKVKTAGILDEGLFKLLTNTTYFNALKWQERRTALEQLAGEISNDMVFSSIAGSYDFSALKDALNLKKTLQEYRAEISNKKKRIRDEKDLLPSRIDEAKRSMPLFVDYSATEKKIKGIEKEIESIEAKIADRTIALQEKQNAKSELMQDMHKLSTQAKDIEFAERNKVQDRKRERDQDLNVLRTSLMQKKEELQKITNDLAGYENKHVTILSNQTQLRTKWAEVDAEKLDFKPGEFHCPTCKREYEASNVETKKQELTQNFNQDKSRRLTEITEKGKQLNKELSEVEAHITNYTSAKNALETAIVNIRNDGKSKVEENERLSANDEEQYNNAMLANAEYQQLVAKIKALDIEINQPIASEDNSGFTAKKKELQAELDGYKNELSGKGQRERIEIRISELQDSESKMANELATLEGIEFSIQQFEKAKMNMLEEKVNSMFKIVRFKLFEEQINGGEVPCCETLINGVPYSDANTASKIQAGVDIINTLSHFYQTSAPIFIDNRESVFEIPASESQIINLIASKPDKQLRVEQQAA